VLSEANLYLPDGSIGSELNRHKIRRFTLKVVECMNSACREMSLGIEFHDIMRIGGNLYHGSNGDLRMSFLLRPSSIAKPQHSSVPPVLVVDYEEACAIVGASPKAAATLARRCLQGMIRDFCGISKRTLQAEIIELKKQVEVGTAPRQVSDEPIDAIDAVRQLGNIGAHFEQDINVIVEVEPEEATALIGLVELLFQEWYVAKYQRQQRLAGVRSIAEGKREKKLQGASAANEAAQEAGA
jgi:hypothetical protein